HLPERFSILLSAMTPQRLTTASPETEWDGFEPAPRGFKLMRSLGAGTWAENFLVVNQKTGEWLVVKQPFSDILRTFPALANRMASVATEGPPPHPRLVCIRDQGHHDGRPYLMFSYRESGNLWARMAPGGVLTQQPAEQLAVWLSSVAEALDFIHARGHV